jgi:hypothetical protein
LKPNVLERALVAVVLGAAALAAGCDDVHDPVEPPVAADTGAPSFAGSPPEQSGPIVYRTNNDGYIFVHPLMTDRRSGLWSIHASFDFGSFCRGEGIHEYPTLEQLVDVAAMEEAVMRLSRADELYTAVATQSFNTIGTCPELLEALVADGTATWQNTDNDLFASGSRTNAFGHNARGILDLAAGGQARYSEVARYSIRGGGNATLVYQINLDPID